MGGKHKKCFASNCGLIASFGFDKKSGTKYCSKHKEDGMINLLCKLCKCGTARPTYNFPGLSANFCMKCKEDGMINVNDKRCFCGLSIPSFNFDGLKAKFCFKCKTDGMKNVNDIPCKCGKSTKAIFNFEGLKPRFCSKCKTDGMVNLNHKKCFCGKVLPSFNFEGLKPEYCSKCKIDGMVLVKKRLCLKCNLNQANYNFLGEKPKFCGFCKDDTMVNIVNKCKSDFCTSSGRSKYDYYCTHCFINLFPNDPRTSCVRFKTKEIIVRDFLNENFEGFIHDEPIWTGNCDCSHRRRIDFRKLIGNTLLCIETDEFQHRRYDKKDEELRYEDLYMAFSGKFVFIRFNPDSYVDSSGNKMNPNIYSRLDKLYEEIEKQTIRITNEDNNELMEIVYLFYDGNIE